MLGDGVEGLSVVEALTDPKVKRKSLDELPAINLQCPRKLPLTGRNAPNKAQRLAHIPTVEMIDVVENFDCVVVEELVDAE